ncbi:hypothetical protein [Acinetobacter baumannii]|uniref:hypothetical protein n=1 Tax=Acinetobacter baumannii TaxID=470 RepID=UPI0038923BF4
MWIILILIVVGLLIYFYSKPKQENKVSLGFESSVNLSPKNYTFEIVGEQAYQKNLKKIAGPKDEESKFVEVMATVISEPFNQYDKNAVKVEINGLTVGYLSKNDAKQLAGKVINKTVPAVIVGGWLDEEDEGSYGVKLEIRNLNDLL